MKLNIIKVGSTVENEGEVVTVFLGDFQMPPGCVVVVMDRDSWDKLKEDIIE